jgi:hypothetical protein
MPNGDERLGDDLAAGQVTRLQRDLRLRPFSQRTVGVNRMARASGRVCLGEQVGNDGRLARLSARRPFRKFANVSGQRRRSLLLRQGDEQVAAPRSLCGADSVPKVRAMACARRLEDLDTA